MKDASNWLNDLKKLPKIRIPRCIQLTQEVSQVSIHKFSDASEKAYGSMI